MKKDEEAGQLLAQVEQMSKEMVAKDEKTGQLLAQVEQMSEELARLRAQVADPAEGVPEV